MKLFPRELALNLLAMSNILGLRIAFQSGSRLAESPRFAVRVSVILRGFFISQAILLG